MYADEHTAAVGVAYDAVIPIRVTSMSLHHPAQNDLLAALSPAELERLRPALEVVPMPSGRIVHEENQPQRYAYFPTGCIIALLYEGTSGAPAQEALVGREGLVGIASFMGGESTSGQAVVQSSGYAYRLPAAMLHAEFRHGGRLRDRTLAFTQALIAQLTQSAVCQRLHPLEQQVCRWLLLSADRLQRPRLAVGLAVMLRILGASHERVLHAFALLQARGLVKFERGAIEIIDRDGLAEMACECHASVTREYQRLLGPVSPRPAWRPTIVVAAAAS